MKDGKLTLTFMPAIPDYLIPESGIIQAILLGKTQVIYHMARKADVIPGSYEIRSIILETEKGEQIKIHGGVLEDDQARSVRAGQVVRISVEVEN